MKLIEALKQIQDLTRKEEDLRQKVGMYCAYLSHETPMYGSEEKQKAQIKQWIQAHSDILKEVLRLRLAIQKTNIVTQVPIELGGKNVNKSIAEWIHRRRELAKFEGMMWQKLGDKGLKEGQYQQTSGEAMEIRIVRCYDPAERDKKIDQFSSEPILIDARLEIVNAVTDLIE